MGDPITLGVMLAGAGKIAWEYGGKNIIAGAVGNEAHAHLRTAIVDRVRSRRTLDQNHEIAKALRRAQLAAGEYVLLRFNESLGLNPQRALVDQVRKAIGEARDAAPSLKWDDAAQRTLGESFEDERAADHFSHPANDLGAQLASLHEAFQLARASLQ